MEVLFREVTFGKDLKEVRERDMGIFGRTIFWVKATARAKARKQEPAWCSKQSLWARVAGAEAEVGGWGDEVGEEWQGACSDLRLREQAGQESFRALGPWRDSGFYSTRSRKSKEGFEQGCDML